MIKVGPYFWNRRVLGPWLRLRYRLFGPQARVGYMCQVDFDHEIGCALGGNTIYPDIEDLRENRKCVDECGIVEVKIIRTKVIDKGTI